MSNNDVDERLKKTEEWARKKAEEEKEKQQKQVNIKVEVDPEPMKEVLKENAELRHHVLNSEKSTEEQIGKEVKDMLVQKYADLGLECPKLETKADVENAVEIMKALKKPQSSEGGAPQASWESNVETSNQPKGYESYEAMIDDVRNRADKGDKDAQAIYRELMIKAHRGRAETGQGFRSYELPKPEVPQSEDPKEKWKQSEELKKLTQLSEEEKEKRLRMLKSRDPSQDRKVG